MPLSVNAVSPAQVPSPPPLPTSVPPTRISPARSAGWILVLMALVVLCCLYLLVVSTTPETSGFDARVNDLATSGVLPGSGRALAALSSGTDTGPLATASLTVAAGIGFALSMRRAAAFAAMITVSALAVTILKEVVARARPDAGANILGSFAWPSGHSAGALTFALAATLALYRIGRLPGFIGAIGLIPAALLVGYSRVFLSVHWFSDVAAGWAVSVFAVGIVLALQGGHHSDVRHRPAIAYGAVLAAVSVMVTMGLR